MRLKSTMAMTKTKGHHSSISFTFTELLNMLTLGLALFIACAVTPAYSLNIAHGPSSSSSQFRSSLTSTTTEAPSTTTTTTQVPSSTSASTSTTPVVPFTVSPTPFSPVTAAAIAGSDDARSGKRIQMANTPFIRLNRMNTGSRTNSRFLRTFPPLEYLEFARRESIAKHGIHRPANNSPLDQHPMTMINAHGHGHGGSDEDFRFEDDSSGQHYHDHDADALMHNQLSNSPIFYIKLPPAPYVLVPGLGYVSPHPYQSNNNLLPGQGPSGHSASGGGPMMMSPLGAFDFGSSLDAHSSSAGNLQNNVISLPLKFLSNARPAIIVGAKPDNGIHGHDGDKDKHTTLLSGGKYSFNGRPNGVFIVRSPAMSRQLNRRQTYTRQRRYHPRV